MQQQHAPLHSDRHRSSFNLTLIGGLAITAVGLFTLPEGAPWFLIGLAIVAWAWFTTPAHYMIFNDRLVIAYGRPRIRHVLFRQVDQIDPRLVFGSRLLVRMSSGRPLLIQPRDIDEFRDKFQSALDTYRGDHGEGGPPPGEVEAEREQQMDVVEPDGDPGSQSEESSDQDTWRPRE